MNMGKKIFLFLLGSALSSILILTGCASLPEPEEDRAILVLALRRTGDVSAPVPGNFIITIKEVKSGRIRTKFAVSPSTFNRVISGLSPGVYTIESAFEEERRGYRVPSKSSGVKAEVKPGYITVFPKGLELKVVRISATYTNVDHNWFSLSGRDKLYVFQYLQKMENFDKWKTEMN